MKNIPYETTNVDNPDELRCEEGLKVYFKNDFVFDVYLLDATVLITWHSKNGAHAAAVDLRDPKSVEELSEAIDNIHKVWASQKC